MSENEAKQEDGAVATEAPEAAEASAPEAEPGRNGRKQRVGVVVSDKGAKTVIVEVARQFAHPLYGKQVARTKRYPAHDEENQYMTGDRVRIMETRPISKTKHWRVIELIERPE